MQQGIRLTIRTPDEIERILWAADRNTADRMWLESHTETLCNHLVSCSLQPSDVQNRARTEKIQKSPRRDRTVVAATNLPPFAVPFPHADPSQLQQPFLPSGSAAPTYLPHLVPPLAPHAGPSVHPYVHSIRHSHSAPDLPHPQLYPMAPSTISSVSDPSTLSPLDSVSRQGSPTPSDLLFPPPSKRIKRTISGAYYGVQAGAPQRAPWTDGLQELYEDLLAQLTASADFPLNWVSNPIWLKFKDTFIPDARRVTRRQLTYRILPRILKKVRMDLRGKTRGKLATAQCDGWTGGNNHHFIAFLITVERKIYTVDVEDTTRERKTADNLLEMMLKVIEKLESESEWGVKVTAFTTDASGESRKARRLLHKKFPHLVTPNCFAHQIQLIVSDYLKVHGTTFLIYAEKANEVISWLRSKISILACIQELSFQHNGRSLLIIRPVPTRWTAYYLAYCQLLEVRTCLEFIIANDALRLPSERSLITGDVRARDKATKMVEILKDSNFWHALARIKHHLAPLAIAANVTQLTSCRLDEVLLTFGQLVMEFKKLGDEEDQPIVDGVLASIERRWKDADQEVFVAAVLVNPFIRNMPFARTNSNQAFLSNGGRKSLLTRLWRRFYPDKTDANTLDDLRSGVEDYFSKSGSFCTYDKVLADMQGHAARTRSSPDPVKFYQDHLVENAPVPPFIQLAFHIFSISPNSASCERLFSTLGLILTKLHSRLGTKNLVNLAELKLHIRDEQLRLLTDNSGRKKRQFGVLAGADTAPTATTVAPAMATEQIPSIQVTCDLSSTEQADASSETIYPAPNFITQSLQAIVQEIERSADEDDSDSSMFIDDASSSTFSFKILDLFDFTNEHWIEAQMRSAVGSLEDELEVYELLELDASGEADLELDLDDTTENILRV